MDAVGAMQVIRTDAVGVMLDIRTDAVGAMLDIRMAGADAARSRPLHRDQARSLIRYIFDVDLWSYHGCFKNNCRCHLPDLPAAPRGGGDAEGGRAHGQQGRGRSQ